MEPDSKKKRSNRIVTCTINNSNYKKVLFFPYTDTMTFTSNDKKTVETCEKWIPMKKSSHDESILCTYKNNKQIILPPFPRKLRDCFIPRRPNRVFLPHQKVLIEKFRKELPKSYLLYWEMGSGKTLGILSALFSLDKIPPKITIVCSISMIDYWLNNILDFDTKQNQFQVEIMGYSYFENKFLDKFEEEDIKAKMAERVFIIDEAHHYRNMTVNMERAILKLSFAKNLFLLTGTPLVNSTDEMEVWAKLFHIDSIPPKNNNRALIDWINKNLNTKVMYFHPNMNKNMKDNVYPDVEYETVRIPMTWKQTMVYFLSQGMTDFADVCIISAKKNNGLSLHKQVANGFKDETTNTFISPKNDYIISSNDSDKYPLPHVIFSSNLETGVEDIYSKLQKKKVPVKIITGNTQAEERQEIVDEYNQGKIDNLLLSKVGNEGINLLGTGTLFITTRHENEESANQTKARVVRYESHINSENKKVKIVDLISVFPIKDPTFQEKEEMSKHMSKCIDSSISGDKVVSELKDKIKKVNNITVEEHLNNLNKQKEAELKPIIETMRNIGTKNWWTPPTPPAPKSLKEKNKSPKRSKALKVLKTKMISVPKSRSVVKRSTVRNKKTSISSATERDMVA